MVKSEVKKRYKFEDSHDNGSSEVDVRLSVSASFLVNQRTLKHQFKLPANSERTNTLTGPIVNLYSVENDSFRFMLHTTPKPG